jgi:L-threonylcarbamoyladenylate synthase
LIRLAVDAERPDPAQLDRAAAVIRGGGAAAIPTDTLYGLAVDPFDAAAVERLFRLKGRPDDQPVPLIAADREQVERHFGRLTPMAARLAQGFWPGPLTVLVPAPAALPAVVTAGLATVGVRVPAHAVAAGLCRACGTPLTATSANRSGAPPTRDPADVERSLGALIDVLIDAGLTPGGSPSTIVDTTGETPRLVRAGAISWNEVLACVDRA